MTLLIYRLLLRPILSFTTWILSSFNEKLRDARLGRKRWRIDLESRTPRPSELPGPHIHWHVASVGECEQAIPVMRRLDGALPGLVQTLSYSSPSLERFIERGADPIISRMNAISFAPPETPRECNDFMQAIAPDLLILVRYDLWPEMLQAARRRGTTILLICGVLHPRSNRFNPAAEWFFRRLYGMLDIASMVSAEDAERMRRLAPSVTTRVDGDTRYDRVRERAESQRARKEIDAIVRAAEGRPIVMAGSSWEKDEGVLRDVIVDESVLTVLAPHEPSMWAYDTMYDWLMGEIEEIDSLVLSKDYPPIDTSKTIIINRLGILAECYRAADIAFVGGGFGDGVHSLLEPAVHGAVLLSGPRIDRSPDAKALRDAGLLLVVESREECTGVIRRLLSDRERMKELGSRTAQFVTERSGATERLAVTIVEMMKAPKARRSDIDRV